ncbi:MAG TPA: NADH-quinone oxidoreductase subunit J [Verrucomicrobiae bacterium]|nr:NADH-quinone oxidoreductase subunit J [Verrucomicrobiae bacterium]
MNGHDILFWAFSIAMLLCGVGVIASRNPVTSAMFLVVLFFFMAGLFVLLEAFFLAAIQVLVYAGAVMVLFLFVIMLLDIKASERRKFRWLAVLGGVIVAAALVGEFRFVLRQPVRVIAAGTTEFHGGLKDVVAPLFADYMLPFEIIALLLLVAMIGVVLLSKRETK